ncbi:dephospho-CoA kinase [Olivibacter ginsenosidimutans]|uniref:Dephospho-CoA kinase n=1 Tax=Olivibacter ginsenosidimutans TaxID=1176537 RepID=A0ABP9BL25_9SPHI
MEVTERKLHVGITGGIGAGKSVISNMFEVLGYPVFYADDIAKKIMIQDQDLISAIKGHIGDQAYFENGALNRKWLADTVFNDQEKLNLLNTLVHPATIRAYERWRDEQQMAITFKEAALLFESGTYKQNDYTILVTAPKELRIARVVARDQVTAQQVIDRMNKQMDDADKEKLADFVIENDEIHALIPQVLNIEQILWSRLERKIET